jgi:hypothetical protein
MEDVNLENIDGRSSAICGICKTQFYYEEDIGLFSMEPDTCGKEECERQYNERAAQDNKERHIKDKEEQFIQLMKQAKSESEKVIPWASESESSFPPITWDKTDRLCAVSIAEKAIEICTKFSLDGLIFLGESLAPIKHCLKDKKISTSISKVSGSFSDISVKELDPRDLFKWLSYVKEKLPKSSKEIRVGFIDYSASGKTFTSLAYALNLADWPNCTYIFIPIVKLTSTLPYTMSGDIRNILGSKFEMAPLIPANATYACDTLLTDEKMKRILGRRSRKLNLSLWDKNLRKAGMAEGMPEGWRRKVSLQLMDEAFDGHLFPQQPTFTERK